MRINKYIASCGYCSRRKADELISRGKVELNGKVIMSLGVDISEEDVVKVNDEILRASSKNIYLMLNKPKGYITSSNDEKGRRTVFDLVGMEYGRLFSVGRLDKDTTGLLLLTNDGNFAQKLAHPKGDFEKAYEVLAMGIIGIKDKERLERGILIFDKGKGKNFKTAPAKITLIRHYKDKTLLEIKIQEGKNRQVRRMFEAVGSKVLELKRTNFGPYELGHLKEGSFRKVQPLL